MARIFCSLSQKSLWSELIQELDQLFHPTWVGTSSTAFYLRDLGCETRSLDDIGIKAFGLGGKVKSLHPYLYQSIMADRENPKEMAELKNADLAPFDMVMIDIYRLESGEQFAQSQIDIGGPSALRAAAKNYTQCLPIARPELLKELLKAYPPRHNRFDEWVRELPLKVKTRCVADVFLMLSEVNKTIARELLVKDGDAAALLTTGENPMDSAWVNPMPVWQRQDAHTPLALDHPAIVKHPADMKFSWNNMMDIHQAYSMFHWLKAPYMVAIMKHHHPCGIGYSDESIEDALTMAHECDPLSAFGGVYVLSSPCPPQMDKKLKGMFVDLLVVAEGAEANYQAMTTSRPNQRVIAMPTRAIDPFFFQYQRHLTCFGEAELHKGHSLEHALDESNWTIYPGAREMSDEVVQAAKRAYVVAAHLHSNAVCVCHAKGAIGVGVGFVNRVQAITHAVKQAMSFKNIVDPVVLASDGFMPFADNIDALSGLNVQAVIQPGGSKRDADVIQACRDRGITLIMTGARVFFHGI